MFNASGGNPLARRHHHAAGIPLRHLKVPKSDSLLHLPRKCGSSRHLQHVVWVSDRISRRNFILLLQPQNQRYAYVRSTNRFAPVYPSTTLTTAPSHHEQLPEEASRSSWPRKRLSCKSGVRWLYDTCVVACFFIGSHCEKPRS